MVFKRFVLHPLPFRFLLGSTGGMPAVAVVVVLLSAGACAAHDLAGAAMPPSLGAIASLSPLIFPCTTAQMVKSFADQLVLDFWLAVRPRFS